MMAEDSKSSPQSYVVPLIPQSYVVTAVIPPSPCPWSFAEHPEKFAIYWVDPPPPARSLRSPKHYAMMRRELDHLYRTTGNEVFRSAEMAYTQLLPPNPRGRKKEWDNCKLEALWVAVQLQQRRSSNRLSISRTCELIAQNPLRILKLDLIRQTCLDHYCKKISAGRLEARYHEAVAWLNRNREAKFRMEALLKVLLQSDLEKTRAK
jgi:hypothetical protein